MKAERIVSLVPAATEILRLLGVGDRVVGVTHECTPPPGAPGPRVVVHAALAWEGKSSAQIEREAADRQRMGLGLGRLDAQALTELAPDLVLAPAESDEGPPVGPDVARALERLPTRPRVLSLAPRRLEDMLRLVGRLGEAVGREQEAQTQVRLLRRRLGDLRARAEAAPRRPAVCCLDWCDPLSVAGRWVPELIVAAGGEDAFGRAGEPSERLAWETLTVGAPEVLLLIPRWFGVERAAQDIPLLTRRPGWELLPAVRHRRVYALDGPAYFHHPGPRLIDGLELLVGVLNPDVTARLLPGAALWQIS